MRLRNIALAASVATLGLTACGSSNNSTSSPSTPATGVVTAPTSMTADFNAADVAFAQAMIPHHQQAVEMADMALDPAVGASPQVMDLATRIKAAQGPEIQQMTGWLQDWGQPLTMDTTAGTTMGMDSTAHTTMTMDSTGVTSMSGMDGMMSADEMSALAKLKGAEFDKAWLEMMVRHHKGAVSMATSEMSIGKSPVAIALAGKIITAQQAEIAEMKALLGS